MMTEIAAEISPQLITASKLRLDSDLVTSLEQRGREDHDKLMLARRLEDLERRMDEVNRSLVQYLNKRRASQRRKVASGEWPRFRRQAKRLAHYAPS
jgi:hypothetical protein